MIVLVTGSRNYTGLRRVTDTLNSLKDVALLIHGGAPGADKAADAWAWHNSVPHLRWPADWTSHGKSAGPRRNAKVLAFALKVADPAEVLLVAFPGGATTADMTARCRKAGVAIMKVN